MEEAIIMAQPTVMIYKSPEFDAEEVVSLKRCCLGIGSMFHVTIVEHSPSWSSLTIQIQQLVSLRPISSPQSLVKVLLVNTTPQYPTPMNHGLSPLSHPPPLWHLHLRPSMLLVNSLEDYKEELWSIPSPVLARTAFFLLVVVMVMVQPWWNINPSPSHFGYNNLNLTNRPIKTSERHKGDFCLTLLPHGIGWTHVHLINSFLTTWNSK